MNAYELADLLQTTESTNNQASNMLRQQADRIAELEKELHMAEEGYALLHKIHFKTNAEPVAWLLFRDGGESYPEYTTSYKQMREWETYIGDNERIELHYTTPQTKPLSDLDPLFYYNRGFNDALRKIIDTKPLSDEEIDTILSDDEIDTIVRDFFGEVNSFYDFRLVIRRCIAKAIEERILGK